jgi:hypothetical protein
MMENAPRLSQCKQALEAAKKMEAEHLASMEQKDADLELVKEQLKQVRVSRDLYLCCVAIPADIYNPRICTRQARRRSQKQN